MEHFHNLIANIRARTRDTNFIFQHYITNLTQPDVSPHFQVSIFSGNNYKLILHYNIIDKQVRNIGIKAKMA